MNDSICNGNVQVNLIDKGTEFIIQKKDVIKSLIRMLIYYCGLGIVIYFMYNQFFRNAGQKTLNFIVFIVIFYTLMMVVTFLWTVFSKQTLTLSNDSLTIRTHFIVSNFEKTYDLDQMGHMSVAIEETSTRNQSLMDTFKSFLGVITFEYESNKVKFGLGLTDAEGLELIDYINSLNGKKISI